MANRRKNKPFTDIRLNIRLSWENIRKISNICQSNLATFEKWMFQTCDTNKVKSRAKNRNGLEEAANKAEKPRTKTIKLFRFFCVQLKASRKVFGRVSVFLARWWMKSTKRRVRATNWAFERPITTTKAILDFFFLNFFYFIFKAWIVSTWANTFRH